VDRRLAVLEAELGDAIRLVPRPYALRARDVPPTQKELGDVLKEIARAQKEHDGAEIRPDLWVGDDLPRSSFPALVALEAARMQGATAHRTLAEHLKRAAIEQGVNVTRSDVIYELASRAGLQMNRFSAAFSSPETRRWIEDEHALAVERGVKGVPTLVIAGRWMISGLREVGEYREHILSCLGKFERAGGGTSEPLLH
jgi:predicted DsbA family dithiol-disulfide isomerase